MNAWLPKNSNLTQAKIIFAAQKYFIWVRFEFLACAPGYEI
jgi:hypothetical protein